MKELIAALEAATGPDRELDARIRHHVFGDFAFCDFEEGNVCGDCINVEDTPEVGCNNPVGMFDERTSYPRDWRDDERLPHYTGSLDATRELVPEGMHAVIGTHGYAGVHRPGVKSPWYESEAETAELAFPAAALKARDATQG